MMAVTLPGHAAGSRCRVTLPGHAAGSRCNTELLDSEDRGLKSRMVTTRARLACVCKSVCVCVCVCVSVCVSLCVCVCVE
jgi:hypothetical protein